MEYLKLMVTMEKRAKEVGREVGPDVPWIAVPVPETDGKGWMPNPYYDGPDVDFKDKYPEEDPNA